jgi:hypothetical protein
LGATLATNAYEERAAECVRLAERASDPQSKLALLHMAESWRKIIEHAERNSRNDTTYETPPPKAQGN